MIAELNFHSPPAYCPAHGLFPATMIAISGGVGNIRNASVRCPKCAHASLVIPGTYDCVDEGLRILIDPAISVQALLALYTIAQRLENSEISLQQARAAATAIAPKFADLFGPPNWSSEVNAMNIAPMVAAAILYLSKPAARVRPVGRPWAG